KITWKQDDVTHDRFYWLAVDDKNRRRGSLVEASLDEQQITIEKMQGIEQLVLRVNDQMINLDQPLTVRVQGKEVFNGSVNRTIGIIAKTLMERSDPTSIFSAEVTVSVTATK
ncbi:MAG: polyhydroxyalkanoate depolymerase, partial [Planctomycetaceae bacterium]|nr:polyhydroxyalkanoate depolymerase [Planctomycetaceae bacterium]